MVMRRSTRSLRKPLSKFILIPLIFHSGFVMALFSLRLTLNFFFSFFSLEIDSSTLEVSKASI